MGINGINVLFPDNEPSETNEAQPIFIPAEMDDTCPDCSGVLDQGFCPNCDR